MERPITTETEANNCNERGRSVFDFSSYGKQPEAQTICRKVGVRL